MLTDTDSPCVIVHPLFTTSSDLFLPEFVQKSCASQCSCAQLIPLRLNSSISSNAMAIPPVVDIVAVTLRA